MFIHMFFVNVQSCSVLNACYIWIRYAVIQSCFLSTMPPFSCRQISMIFFTRTFDPAWVNITITLLCINHQLKCCNPAVVIFSLHRRFRRCDFEALAHCSCSDSHFSTYAFWHDSLLPVRRHLLTIDLTRATHCPVIAPVVNTVIILTIDLAASSGRHTRQRHMPVDRHTVIPFITSVGSSAPTSRSVASQRLRASSPRRAPLHAAHAFIQLRIIVCSWAPFSPLPLHRPRSTLVFHPPR